MSITLPANLPSWTNVSHIHLTRGPAAIVCGRVLKMQARRPIDERDIDRLLGMLTDRQIADLFGMQEDEVTELRRLHKSRSDCSPRQPKDDSEGKEKL